MSDRLSTRNRFTRRLTMVGVVGAMIVGFLPLGLGVTAAGAATATGGQYVPITPVRIADTRTGSTFPNAGQTMQAGGSVTVALPSSVAGASAVALNVTATNTTGSGFFTVYPAGGTPPLASSLNFSPGANVPNFVIVPVGASNSITIYNGPPGGDGSTGGAADAVVDLQGSFNTVANTSGGAGHFNPLTPARITDTRAGSGQTNAGMTLTAGGTLTVQATGKGGVPATGVSAVEVNVTEAANTAGGFLTVFPQGNTAPTVSNLNYVSGQIIANRVIVPVNPANGQFSIFNHAGNTDVVVDVDGYFTDSTGASGAGSLFNPVTVARVIDTRSSSPIGPNGNLNVPITGIPSGASAAVLNVTEASNTAGGFLTVSPTTPAPLASDVNFVPRVSPVDPKVIVANGDIAALASNGSLNVYNHDGNTNVVLDVAGYFTPAATTPPPTGTGSVTSTPASGPAGTQITGTVVNPTLVNSIAVSGCGVSQTVLAAAINQTTGAFTFGIPNGQAIGPCTLMYVSANSNGTSTTSTSPFTVTAAATTGTVMITPTSGPDGTTVTGTVANPTAVASVNVLGCGLNQTVPAASLNQTTGAFTFVIPAPQPIGVCTFTFTSSNTGGSTTVTSINFTVTSSLPAGTGTVTISPTSGAAGTLVNGTVTNPAGVSNVVVTGCGLNQTIPASAINQTTGAFTFNIPAGQATGACTLTFTSNNTNATTTVTSITFTVTSAIPPAGVGLGTPPTVAPPTLQSARLITNGFNHSAQSIVQYVFSGPVTPNGVIADFSLIGFDTMRDTSSAGATTALSAVQDGSNVNAIDVSYPSQVDPASYTVAAADNSGAGVPPNTGAGNSAVVGTTGADTGLNNPLGTVPLVGSTGPSSVTTGNTTAPDLVSCAVNPANSLQIIYTFDKAVATISGPTWFAWYDAAGTFTVGNSVDPSFIPGSTQVPIDYLAGTTTEVRCATDVNAVQGNAAGAEGQSPLGGVGGPTSAPDLTSITPVSGNSTQFDFHFNKTVLVATGPGQAPDYI